jgi:hypothetical protein
VVNIIVPINTVKERCRSPRDRGAQVATLNHFDDLVAHPFDPGTLKISANTTFVIHHLAETIGSLADFWGCIPGTKQ